MVGYIGASVVGLSTVSADIDGTVTADALTVDGDVSLNGGTSATTITSDANRSGAGFQITGLLGKWNGTNAANIGIYTGSDTTNKDDGVVKIQTSEFLGTLRNRLQVHNNGDISFYEDTGSTVKFFWDASAESLGIGTTSPASYGQLTLYKDGANDTKLALANNGNGGGTVAWTLKHDTSYDLTLSHNAGVGGQHLIFGTKTSGGESMRIDSSGHLFVGNSSATGMATGASLREGTFVNQDGGLYSQRNGDAVIYLSKSSGYSSSTMIGFWTAGSIDGSITTSGTSVAYNTTSDYRLKENITDITDGITRVKQLEPRRFNFIANPDTTVDGFLAHEAATVVPEAVTGTQDAMRDEEYQVSAATGDIYTPSVDAVVDEEGNEVSAAIDEVIHSSNVEQPETLEEGQLWRETTAAVMGTRSVPDYQGIDQSKLVPLLTAALQESIAKIEALETRVAALEAN